MNSSIDLEKNNCLLWLHSFQSKSVIPCLCLSICPRWKVGLQSSVFITSQVRGRIHINIWEPFDQTERSLIRTQQWLPPVCANTTPLFDFFRHGVGASLFLNFTLHQFHSVKCFMADPRGWVSIQQGCQNRVFCNFLPHVCKNWIKQTDISTHRQKPCVWWWGLTH